MPAVEFHLSLTTTSTLKGGEVYLLPTLAARHNRAHALPRTTLPAHARPHPARYKTRTAQAPLLTLSINKEGGGVGLL